MGCAPFTTVLFTRVPVPGKVKTRLSKVLTDEQCACLQRAMALDAVERLSEAGGDLVLCYSDDAVGISDGAAIQSCFLKEAADACHPSCTLHFAVQEADDFGDRMRDAMEAGFLKGEGPCVLVGSDIPQITSEDVIAAATALESDDVVLGPGYDGGYWLAGCRKPFPELFSGKHFGEGNVIGEAVATCRNHGRSVALLHRMLDVDSPADLHVLCERAYARDSLLGPRTVSEVMGMLE